MKKILSLILTLTLTLGLSVTAFAESYSVDSTNTAILTVSLRDIQKAVESGDQSTVKEFLYLPTKLTKADVDNRMAFLNSVKLNSKYSDCRFAFVNSTVTKATSRSKIAGVRSYTITSTLIRWAPRLIDTRKYTLTSKIDFINDKNGHGRLLSYESKSSLTDSSSYTMLTKEDLASLTKSFIYVKGDLLANQEAYCNNLITEPVTVFSLADSTKTEKTEADSEYYTDNNTGVKYVVNSPTNADLLFGIEQNEACKTDLRYARTVNLSFADKTDTKVRVEMFEYDKASDSYKHIKLSTVPIVNGVASVNLEFFASEKYKINIQPNSKGSPLSFTGATVQN